MGKTQNDYIATQIFKDYKNSVQYSRPFSILKILYNTIIYLCLHCGKYCLGKQLLRKNWQLAKTPSLSLEESVSTNN